MPKLSHIALSLTLCALVVINAYQHNQIQSLIEKDQVSANPSKSDIIVMIDQRLDVVQQRKTKEQFDQLKAEFELADQRTPDDRLIYGSLDARITLQEFGDIECPFCRKMHSGLKQVIDHSDGVVNWEFKHFPLKMHNPVAALQAKAIECVKASYGNRVAWTTLDQLFAQTGGNGQGVPDMTGFVRSLGLSGQAISMCMASDAHEERINRDYQEGQALGISSTPALRILDHKTGKDYIVKGYKTPEQLLQALQHVLRS